MAYDEYLADRIRQTLRSKRVTAEEKKMMGGLAFMVDEKMCVGIVKENLMVRVGPDRYEEALQHPGCRPMDFTGRPLKGFVFVSPEAVDEDEQLSQWVQRALDYNPLAQKSKKKKKKS